MPTALHKGVPLRRSGSQGGACAPCRRPLYYVSPTRRVGRGALRLAALRAATIEAEEVQSSQAEENSTSGASSRSAAEHSAAPPASLPALPSGCSGVSRHSRYHNSESKAGHTLLRALLLCVSPALDSLCSTFSCSVPSGSTPQVQWPFRSIVLAELSTSLYCLCTATATVVRPVLRRAGA